MNMKPIRTAKDHKDALAEISKLMSSVSRETLYRTLSSRGNPTIRTLSAVLKATGLKFGVTAH